MTVESLHLRLKRNECVVLADKRTFEQWEEGLITTREARKRIADNNGLDLRVVTKERFLFEAHQCGYFSKEERSKVKCKQLSAELDAYL